jgi:hypothetical protein
LIIPPNHTIVPVIKIAFYAIPPVTIERLIIVTGTGEAVPVFYYFKFYIFMIDLTFPYTGNGLRVGIRIKNDTG